MLDFLNEIDENLFLLLHTFIRGEEIDNFMWLISDRITWIAMYGIIIWWLIKNAGYRNGTIIIIAILMATLCADQTCAKVVRPMVERLRPAHPENPISDMVLLVNNYRGGSFGFPSSHAANTFMLATFLTMFVKNRYVIFWMFFWAFLNCISRIYLGVHYPGDILFGAIVGVIFALVWALIVRWLLYKINKTTRNVLDFESYRYLIPISGIITVFIILILSLIY